MRYCVRLDVMYKVLSWSIRVKFMIQGRELINNNYYSLFHLFFTTCLVYIILPISLMRKLRFRRLISWPKSHSTSKKLVLEIQYKICVVIPQLMLLSSYYHFSPRVCTSVVIQGGAEGQSRGTRNMSEVSFHCTNKIVQLPKEIEWSQKLREGRVN